MVAVYTLASTEAWMLFTEETMPITTKFLRLRQPAKLGHRIGGGCVCRLGGWDRHQIFYVVLVSRVKDGGGNVCC